MNFFKFYIGDYQRDTAHLSIQEHGVYLLMLQHYYATEKALPAGKALYRMLRVANKAERDAVDAVVKQFWIATPEGLVNARADIEIGRASAQAEANRRTAVEREANRRGAQRHHDLSTNRVTNEQRSQTPDTRNQTDQKEARSEARPNVLPAPEVAALQRFRSQAPATKREMLIAVLLQELGVTCDESHPVVSAWARDAVTDEKLREAVAVARKRKPRPEQIPVRYLVPIIRELMERPVDAGGARERDWERIWPDDDQEINS